MAMPYSIEVAELGHVEYMLRAYNETNDVYWLKKCVENGGCQFASVRRALYNTDCAPYGIWQPSNHIWTSSEQHDEVLTFLSIYKRLKCIDKHVALIVCSFIVTAERSQ